MTATHHETDMTYHGSNLDETPQINAFQHSGNPAANVHLAPGSDHYDQHGQPESPALEQRGAGFVLRETNETPDIEEGLATAVVTTMQKFALLTRADDTKPLQKVQMKVPGTSYMTDDTVVEHTVHTPDDVDAWTGSSTPTYEVDIDGDPVYDDESPLAMLDNDGRVIQPRNDNPLDSSMIYADEHDHQNGMRPQLQQQHQGLGVPNRDMTNNAELPRDDFHESGQSGLVYTPYNRPYDDPNTPEKEAARVWARGPDMNMRFAPLPVPKMPYSDPSLNLMNILNGHRRR